MGRGSGQRPRKTLSIGDLDRLVNEFGATGATYTFDGPGFCAELERRKAQLDEEARSASETDPTPASETSENDRSQSS
jgi:hypothetical protein